MGITKVHNKIFAVFRSLITNAVDFQLFGKTGVNAGNHVGNKGSGKTVKASHFFSIIRAGHDDLAVFDLDFYLRTKALFKGDIAALYRNNVSVNLDFNACRYSNRFFTDTRHSVSLLFTK